MVLAAMQHLGRPARRIPHTAAETEYIKRNTRGKRLTTRWRL